MKYSKPSTSIKPCLQIVLVLAVLSFGFGSRGISTVHAADPAATNDLIGNRIVIGALPYNPGPVDTTGASRELPDEPAPGNFPGDCEGADLRTGRNTVWYEYSPGGANTPVYLDTSGSTTSVPDPLNGGVFEYDTYIAVFVRTNLAQPVSYTNLNMVACTDNPNNATNQAQLAFTAEAGKTYYITIAEYDGVFGDGNQYPGYDGGSLSFKMSTALTISGNVGLKGVALTYKGGATTSDSNGNYSLAVPSGFTETVTPSLLGTVFTPANKSYISLGSSATGQNYTGHRFNTVSKWTASFDLSHSWTVKDYVRTVGDVNGDGKFDLVGFGLDGVYVATSTGTGFNAISKWSNSLAAANGWTVAGYVRTVGDVNNDGRDDLVGFGSDGVYVALALNPGPGFGAVTKWSSSFGGANGWTVSQTVRTVGDVNGDGRADIIGYGSDGVYVGISNGVNGFNAITKWSSSLAAANGWTVADYVRTVGDVNGDGSADLVGFGQDGVYVATSNGVNGFNPVSKWLTAFDLAHGWTVKDYVRTIGDVNGDGKADAVGFGLDGVYVATSNGVNGFNPVSKWSSVLAAANGWNVKDYVRILGDISGDGLDDLVGFGLDGVYIAP